MRAAALSALLALLTLGCSTRPAVRAEVTRGVPRESLAFRLLPADTLRVASIEVIQVNVATTGRGRGSPGDVYWVVIRSSGSDPLPLPASLAYGQTPPGFAAKAPARALHYGRYELRVLSGGSWHVSPFRITEHGLVE